MNWISITLNVVETHKCAHTHTYCFCERWGFRPQLNSHLTSLTHTKTQPGVSHCYLQPAPIPWDCTWERGDCVMEGERKGPTGEQGGGRGGEVDGGRGWERTSWRVSASSRCWSDNETLIRASQMAWWNTWILSVLIPLPLSFYFFPFSLTISFDLRVLFCLIPFFSFCFVFSFPLFFYSPCPYQLFFSTSLFFSLLSMLCIRNVGF